jgi:hypothetical protein
MKHLTKEQRYVIQTLHKRKALQLYLEELGFRSIGRVLGVSNVSVLNWIRNYGEKAKDLQTTNSSIKFVELDEMQSYIGNKKTIARFGLLLIDLGKDLSTSLFNKSSFFIMCKF